MERPNASPPRLPVSGSVLMALALGLVGLALMLKLNPGVAMSEPPQRELTVGLYENEPKIYSTDNGEPAGLFVELLEEIARQENWALNYRQCQWHECLDQLYYGEIDLMPDMATTPGRQEQFFYHDIPVALAWSQFYTRAGESLASLAELSGKQVAVLEAGVQEDFLNRLRDDEALDIEVLAQPSMESAFEAVMMGQADVAASNNFYGRRNASHFKLVETPVTFDHTSLHYVSNSEAYRPVLETIDAYLADWKADPDSHYYAALQSTIRRPADTVLPTWLIPVTAATLLLLLALVAHGWLLRWRVKSQTARLRDVNTRLEHLLDSSPVILYSADPASHAITWVSPNIERILSFTPERAVKPGWWETQVHPDDFRRVRRGNTLLQVENSLVLEYRFIDAYGKTRFLRDEKRRIAGGEESGGDSIIGSWTDLTRGYEQQERMHFLSNYDMRTGLLNRNLLQDRLTQLVEQHEESNNRWMVVFLDLDRFKKINESLGAIKGDLILKATAKRLLKLSNDRDTVARIGSDEFCIILDHHRSLEASRQFMDTLIEAFREPLQTGEQSMVLTVSAGCARFPDDGKSSELLMAACELALDTAKRKGGDTWVSYEREMGETSDHRLFLERDLRQAIAKEEFLLHYQPKYRLDDGSLVGVEALIRWEQPERGMVSPGEFIPLAEETGLIEQIDQWVLEEACRQMVAWDEAGESVPQIAVNISARELKEETLLARVRGALASSGLAAERLELEITETMLMESPERSMRILGQLDTMGVKISMDDFGTGYSNLAYIWQLPLHGLKVDQTLIKDIESSRHIRSIIQAIIAMGESLNLQIVAEGIETQAQLDFLKQEGCDIGQGFLLNRPAPTERLPLGAMNA